MKEYEYKPLRGSQWMRVLRIRPGPTSQDEIYCRLDEWIDPKATGKDSVIDMESDDYEALSWCWGVGDYNKYIFIEGDKGTSWIRVYEHLYEAIKSLRHPDMTRTVWVDAICINQSNLEERNQQVAKMNEIYGNATTVCIWLTKWTKETDLALEFIKERLLHLDTFDELFQDLTHIDKWTAVLGLMKQQWFQRRWVVQEVSLAQKAVVYCGRDFVSWEKFGAAVSLLADFDTSTQKLSDLVQGQRRYPEDFFKDVPALGAASLVKTTNRLFKRSVNGILQRTSSLEDIVANLAMLESSEPRDTIYALLALAKDTQPSLEGIPDYLYDKRLTEKQKNALRTIARLLPNPYRRSYNVDYNQQVVDIYQQFIAFAITKSDPTRALDIICRPFAPSYTQEDDFRFNKARLAQLTDKEKQETVKLPSWISNREGVPFAKREKQWKDLHEGERSFTMVRQRGDLFVSTPDSITYCAAGSKAYAKDKVRFRKRSDHYSMFVEGFILDTVEEVFPASQLGNIPEEWLSQRVECEKRDPNMFWKTLVADRSPKGAAPLYYKNAYDAALMNAHVKDTFNVKQRMKDPTSEIVASILRQIEDTIWGRRLIVTKRGCLGLAPKNTAKGDVVCIIYGCTVPVIMKQIEKSEQEKEKEAKDDEEDRRRRQSAQVKKVKAIIDRKKARRAAASPKLPHVELADTSNGGAHPNTQAGVQDPPGPAAREWNADTPVPRREERSRELPTPAEPIVVPADGPVSFHEAILTFYSSRHYLNLLLKQPFLRRTISLTAIVCAISCILGESFAGALVLTLAVPHLVNDLFEWWSVSTMASADQRMKEAGIAQPSSSKTLPRWFMGEALGAATVAVLCLGIMTRPMKPMDGMHALGVSLFYDTIFPENLPGKFADVWGKFRGSRVGGKVTAAASPTTPPPPYGNGDVPRDAPPDPAFLSQQQQQQQQHFPHPTEGEKQERTSAPPRDEKPLDHYYELVGESYIHGMMNGEAIELQNESTSRGESVERIISRIFEMR